MEFVLIGLLFFFLLHVKCIHFAQLALFVFEFFCFSVLAGGSLCL